MRRLSIVFLIVFTFACTTQPTTTDTPTPSETPTLTLQTPSETPSHTATDTPTNTPSNTPKATFTLTPTETPTLTPTPTQTPTRTNTPTPSKTSTRTPTATREPIPQPQGTTVTTEADFLKCIATPNCTAIVVGKITLTKRTVIRVSGVTVVGFGSTALLTNSVANVYAVLEVVDTSNVTIRNIRIRRTANTAPGKGDGLSITRCNGCLIENISVAWSIDGGIDINSSQNVTVRNSIIAEPLRNSTHIDGSHSMCMLVFTSSNVLIQGNLFISGKERCGPRVVSSTNVTIRDNVSYNFGSHPTVVSGDYSISTVNYINNKLIRGPDSPDISYGVAVTNAVFAVSVYADKKLVREGDWRYVVSVPFGNVGVSVPFVIEDAGAQPSDAVDRRLRECVSTRLCVIVDKIP